MNIADKTVGQFHYVLKAENGAEIESSHGNDPLTYLHGANNTLPGLEKALVDKAAGDKFSVTLQPDEAYGERNEALVERVSVKHLHGLPSKNAKWQPGMVAVVQTEQGQRQVTVLKTGKFMVTVDINPPLAGKVLTFDIDILDVRAATDEESEHGHVHNGSCGHEH